MSLLLAIDTSGGQGGIALANYDGEFAVVVEEAEISGGTFSAELVPEIARMLSSRGLGLKDVSAIGVVTGPGSFTGLRIGLAAVKGLCEARPVPMVAVTMLELLAAVAQADEVTTLLDASRGEAYVGRFRLVDGISAMVSEELLAVPEIRIEGLALTPDAAIAGAVGAVEVPRPKPSDVAMYAVRKLARGLAIEADAVDAHYIRRSDAEIFAKPVVGK